MKTRRKAASLMEIMVVLVIIIIIAAVSVPSIRGMYGSYKLNGGVDSVRSAWADARARAIEEGRPYRFAVEPEGSSFRVAPDQADYWDGGTGPSNDPSGKGMILEKSLPGGVRFAVNGEAVVAPPEEKIDSLEEKPVTASNWSSAIVFLPDGTAREDVKIYFHLRGARPTVLCLRGMTGNVSVLTEQ